VTLVREIPPAPAALPEPRAAAPAPALGAPLRRPSGPVARRSAPDPRDQAIVAALARVVLARQALDATVDLESPQLAAHDRLQRAFDNAPPMGFGEAGDPVAALQQGLLDAGFLLPKSTKSGAPDGIFGSETLTVVKAFQHMQGIAKDGVVGRNTLAELDGRLTGNKPPGTGPSGEPGGGEVTASQVDVMPPTVLECGGFERKMDWVTNGRNGYLVQEITRTRKVTGCDGSEHADSGDAHFWEAWRVQEDGGIHPHSGGAHDRWQQNSVPDSKGTWSIKGDLHFVEQLDPAAKFSPFGSEFAGGLYSTTTAPSNLGPVLLTNSSGESWDCCT
jgi:peptidoglycan hydrolase-like protein with peptidoglycan-binding domain